MALTVVDGPFSARLVGLYGERTGRSVPETGMALMERLFLALGEDFARSDGQLRWVYDGSDGVYVGVGWTGAVAAGLQGMDIAFTRHATWEHRGDYAGLPEAWSAVWTALEATGERAVAPTLEVYGHFDPDPAQRVTTLVVGLA